MDFRRATALFADPDFDGDPVQIYQPGPNDPPVPPDEPPIDIIDIDGPGDIIVDPPDGGIPPGPPRRKYFVDNVNAFSIWMNTEN
jgi:type I restriction enzyme, R subunit